jgi:MFS family permease
MHPAPAAAAARPRTSLSAASTAHTMRLAVVDGALFALMLGVGETCFLAEAVRIGAGPLAISLITSLPLLCGGLGSVLVLRLLRAVPQRRTWVVACALLQVGALLALAAAVAGGADTTATVLGLLCVYHTCGQTAGTAWSSWYGDVVPRELRGRYFAGRNRIVHLATFASVLGAGAVLHACEPANGFALLFALAAAVRLLSAWLLSVSQEPPFRGMQQGARPLQFLASRRGRGRNAWRLLLGGGLFHVGVYVGAPFFAPYMLQECHLGYSGYMITLGTVVATKALSLPLWGRVVDRFGSHRAFALALFLSAWIPLPFVFATSLPALALAYGWSGLAWGGYEVAAFAVLLDSSTRRTRPQIFAAQGLVNGSAQLGGSLAGAALASHGTLPLVFAVSFACRIAVALGLPWFVRALPARRADRGRSLALRTVGFRAHGGPAHRPVLDESGNPPTPRLRPAADADPAPAAPAATPASRHEPAGAAR